MHVKRGHDFKRKSKSDIGIKLAIKADRKLNWHDAPSISGSFFEDAESFSLVLLLELVSTKFRHLFDMFEAISLIAVVENRMCRRKGIS